MQPSAQTSAGGPTLSPAYRSTISGARYLRTQGTKGTYAKARGSVAEHEGADAGTETDAGAREGVRACEGQREGAVEHAGARAASFSVRLHASPVACTRKSGCTHMGVQKRAMWSSRSSRSLRDMLPQSI
eukprot:5284077-Pleurochrysis_carterae.AAC.4